MGSRLPSRSAVWITGSGLFVWMSGALGSNGMFLSARARIWSGIIAVLVGLFRWWSERQEES